MAATERPESAVHGGDSKMKTRTANSLLKLRDQIDAAHPNRNKASDGTIGDEAHQKQGSASDHNPWFTDKNGIGVVTALDITHDPANGVDIDKLSDQLIASRDSRIKYVIANGLIAGPGSNWQWQESSGHYEHIHISVNTSNYDDTSEWKIGGMMDEADAKYLYKLGLHRDPENDKAWRNLVGKKFSTEAQRVMRSREWLTQNHATVYFSKEQNLTKQLKKQITDLSKQLAKVPGDITEAEKKLQAIRDVLGIK